MTRKAKYQINAFGAMAEITPKCSTYIPSAIASSILLTAAICGGTQLHQKTLVAEIVAIINAPDHQCAIRLKQISYKTVNFHKIVFFIIKI